MTEVEIGKFDTKIYLPGTGTNNRSQGEVVIDYSPIYTSFAERRTNIDEFNSNSNLEQAESLTIITYKCPVTTRHRVRIGCGDYEITGIDPMERMQLFMMLNLKRIKHQWLSTTIASKA